MEEGGEQSGMSLKTLVAIPIRGTNRLDSKGGQEPIMAQPLNHWDYPTA